MSTSAAEDTPDSNIDPNELNEVIDEFMDSADSADLSDDSDDSDADEVEEQSESKGEGRSETEINLRLLPIQLTAKKASRGRPREIKKVPTIKDLEYHAKMSAEKARFVDRDPLVEAAKKRSDVAEVLHRIKTEIACEAAALHFQRLENEKYGKDTSQTSSRRIDALTKIAHIELEIKKLGADLIDLHGERFQKVFALWISMLREVAVETLPPETIDLFFNRLSSAMEGWEDKATDTIR